MPNSRVELKALSQHSSVTEHSNEASGIYTWIITSDTVHGDSLVADCFGFGIEEVRTGLPLSHFLERIHKEDLPRVAKAIHHAVVTGLPFQEPYRICRPDGSVIEITAFGVCFRDADNEPAHYAGILFPTSSQGVEKNMLLNHLLTAYDIAAREGRVDVAQKIADAMVEMGNVEREDEPDTVRQLQFH